MNETEAVKKPDFNTMQIVTLPREVLKWIQSLDLTYSIRDVRKAFDHGFLVAQILSRYSSVVEMHRIDNGHSSERRKDNWKQIAAFIKKDQEHLHGLNIEDKDVNEIVQNRNNDVLCYVMKMYSKLTGRNLITFDDKSKYRTDVDDKNKSYLLKDTGELELLKKDEDVEKKDQEQKTQKTTAPAAQPKPSNMLMKAGEVKPISTKPNDISDKKFNPKISETKTYDRGGAGKILRQTNYLANSSDALSKSTGGKSGKEEKEGIKIMPAISEMMQMSDNQEQENKNAKNKNNPFELLEDMVVRKIGNDHRDVLNNLRVDKKFIYTYFKYCDEASITIESLNDVLAIIIYIIDEKFNTLHENPNEYVSLFLWVFGAYLSIDNRDPKFDTLHDFLISFFIKSKKNNNEEMFIFFKHIIIKKIFETINSPEYSMKVPHLCDLVFKIFDPNEKTQIEFFKIFKDYVIEEDILYFCFRILHDLFPTFPDSFIDICLFYIISGLSSTSTSIRFDSLYMLYKYVLIKSDFFYTLEKKLRKLAKSETSRDNAYLIVKMSITVLKNLNDVKKKNQQSNVKKSIFSDRGDDETSLTQNLALEMGIPNAIISNVVEKFCKDDFLTLIIISSISEILYDNIGLIKIFLTALYKSSEVIKRHIIEGADIDNRLNQLIENTILKVNHEFAPYREWNYALLFKGYILWAQETKTTYTVDFDYWFLDFCLKNPLNHSDNETWRKFFSQFHKMFFKDLKNPENCHALLNVLEKFLFFESIQKPILEDCYESFQNILKEIWSDKTNPVSLQCQEIITVKLREWSTGGPTIGLKEAARRLLENANSKDQSA